ncbi:MAG TPA: carbohydrate ABC transporter permease [Atribacteraceae bacterium]|nr:carbohydrate ABC transporter permease [Atribacteraceae bacterium]
MNNRRGVWKVIKPYVAIIVSLIYFSPVLWVFLTAFKPRTDIVSPVPRFIFAPTLDHFSRLFFRRVTTGTGEVLLEATPFVRFFSNSIFLSLFSVALALALGTFAAYAISRFPMRNKGFLMFYILSNRMLPPIAVVVPLYLMYLTLGIMNTHIGMLLLYTAFSIPLAIWMMKSFFDDIPHEIEEAARVDGSSRFRAFYKTALPQVWAGIAATFIISLIFVWNEFLFALMLTGRETRTVPVALSITLRGERGVDWGLLAAVEGIYVIPAIILAFVAQGYLLRGLTFGTVRK